MCTWQRWWKLEFTWILARYAFSQTWYLLLNELITPWFNFLDLIKSKFVLIYIDSTKNWNCCFEGSQNVTDTKLYLNPGKFRLIISNLWQNPYFGNVIRNVTGSNFKAKSHPDWLLWSAFFKRFRKNEILQYSLRAV